MRFFHALLFLPAIFSLVIGPVAPALAQASVESPSTGISGSGFRTGSTIKLNDLENPSRSLTQQAPSDTFPTVNLNLSVPQPLSLSGVKIAGLRNEEFIKSLAYNHMIVLQGASDQGTAGDTMYKIYESNRQGARSNFVTADVFVHAYFTYVNALTIKVFDESLYPELVGFLSGLRESIIRDYRACEIAEIKDDIQRNLAFILVAERILSPSAKQADYGGASDLCQEEIAAIKKGGVGQSPIFNRVLDYASVKPLGYFAQAGRAARVYSAYAWLSRFYFGLSDLTNNTQGGGGNSFRRAVLLYRALSLGKCADGRPLMLSWRRIADIVAAVSQGRLCREPSIFPEDMRPIFSDNRLEFKDLLTTLAQPLTRARLLISVKKQKPQGLDPTSIFDMERARKEEEANTVFRLFSPLSTIELDFLRECAATFQDEGQERAIVPLSLFALFAMGSPMASNTLASIADQIDQKALKVVPEFIRVLARRRIEDSDVSANQPEKRWSIISEYFKPLKKGSQAVLVSHYWMTQRLLSASGALIDSFCTYDPSDPLVSPRPTSANESSPVALPPVDDDKDKSIVTAKSNAAGASAAGTGATANAPKANAANVGKTVNFHYLEPALELYRKLSTYAGGSVESLNKLGAMPADMKSKGADFIRLMDRLKSISEKELAVEALPAADFRLLANVDQILPSICGPTSNNIYLPGPNLTGGASIGVGDPGSLYILFNTNQGPFLSRGALYTYYEISGGPFKAEHWARKKSFGFLRPPSWVRQFDVLEEGGAGAAGGANTAGAANKGGAAAAKTAGKPSDTPVNSQLKLPAILPSKTQPNFPDFQSDIYNR